jgi:hypothetical protein
VFFDSNRNEWSPLEMLRKSDGKLLASPTITLSVVPKYEPSKMFCNRLPRGSKLEFEK